MSTDLETPLIIILGIIFVTLLFLGKNIFDLIIKIIKGEDKIIKQTEILGFKIYPQHDPGQFNKNIYQSGFLNNLYGNWKNLHGKIIPSRLIGTNTYKGYEIEFIYFFIQYQAGKSEMKLHKTKKISETHEPIEKFGPFTGLHFNLKNKYAEVDIIYKKNNTINKIIGYLTDNNTIKPRTWETESNEFNKYYAILSHDYLTNLRVLTPDVMAKILDSNLKINIKIIDNHLLIYTASKFKKGNELKILLEIGWRIAENLE